MKFTEEATKKYAKKFPFIIAELEAEGIKSETPELALAVRDKLGTFNYLPV